MQVSFLPVLSRVLLVAVVVIAGISAEAAEFTQAPDLEYYDLDGSKVRIDFEAKPLTLVNFWATWCLPCHEEMPQISRLNEEYGDAGLQSIGVAVESGGPPDVAQFLSKTPELKVSYPLLVGGPVVLEEFGDIIVVPTTYLLDSSGKVLETYMGVTHEFYKEVSSAVVKHEFYKEVSSAVVKHLPPRQPAEKGESPGKGDPSPEP